MASSLLDLTLRLEQAVPSQGGIPADYGQLVLDAVNQLGSDIPIITSWQFTTVVGQAEYELPSDFLKVIEMVLPTAINGTIVTDSGLVPVSGSWSQTYYIEGPFIRFDPAPQAVMTRVLRYAAGYILDEQGKFPRLSENAARIALLYAQYLALMEQANTTSHKAWSYRIGDEAVDKKGQGPALLAQSNEVLQAYSRAVKPFQGYGSQYRNKVLDPNAY